MPGFRKGFAVAAALLVALSAANVAAAVAPWPPRSPAAQGPAAPFPAPTATEQDAPAPVPAAATRDASALLPRPQPSDQQPQEIAELRNRVAELEAALAALRSDHDARFAAIEAQLARLTAAPAAATEAGGALPGQAAMTAEERAELERELAGILAETPASQGGAAAGQQPGQAGGQRFSSQTRNLNQLNPEISATGDVFGVIANRTGDPEANQFRFAEFEVALQAPLDPYSAAKFFVVHEEGEVKLEEGYIEYNALPGGLSVKAGEMRLDWGKLNRWHQHGLPQADRPLAHLAILGEEGLTGLGGSVSWLTPSFLGDYNEVIVQVTNDNNDVAFSGRGFDQPVFLIHETNYFDISPATYVEIGLSAATGTADFEGELRSQVYGADWNFNWAPPETALYRGFELRGELLWQRRDTPVGTISSTGAYTYGVFKLNRRSYVGLRGDWTELPEEPGESLWGASPYFEWWQSEWARFRIQYSYNSRQLEAPEPEHKFYFQLTWAIGPHKHEKY
ncbi:MAG TPA: hypothetical protein VGD06_06335 [Acidobacteriota bacterium]